jgi:hypothetical protein
MYEVECDAEVIVVVVVRCEHAMSMRPPKQYIVQHCPLTFIHN